jgi:cytochrome oxidase assembly protein ShyY1
MKKPLSVWRVAVRPRWLAALALALVVAAVFAALGQWQLERSIASATIIERDTETVMALDVIEQPQSTITTEGSGRMVSVICSIDPIDDVLVTNRKAPDRVGSWYVRHCLTVGGDSLAVVAGWTRADTEGGSIAGYQGAVVGRYVPTESPQQTDLFDGQREAVAVSELLNLWQDPGPVYGGYLVMEQAPEGLDTISTSAPVAERSLNILNLFYALEWAIFGLFALYLWFRLVKDAWERELEEAQDLDAKLE